MTQSNFLNGRYEKILDSNQGSMGTKCGVQGVTFCVTDKNDDNKKKVVKKIYIEGIDYKTIEELEEIKWLRRLKHTNIIKYYEDFSDSIFLYIVFEHCESGDLQTYLNKNGKIELFKFIIWFNQLVLGLKYLHENKCIHRDLKPENILIKKDVLKICDFGIFKFMKSLNLIAKDIGSVEYWSPEIIRGEKYDFKVDIWALGVIYYQMNTNELPFSGYIDQNKKKFDEDKLKNEIFTKQTPPLSEETRRYKFLNNLLIRMLEKDQKDRINIFIIYEELKEFSKEIIGVKQESTLNDRNELNKLIDQWNSNHFDLFSISKPNRDLEFHGIIKFHYQDFTGKFSTKCIDVDSTSRAENLISVLMEKFLPDMRLLLETPYKLPSVNSFAIYEIHVNSERKLGGEEKPLYIQLDWCRKNTTNEQNDGKFLFRNEDFKKTVNYEDICSIDDVNNSFVSFKHVTDINSISTISNPEVRMAQCRQEKLEEKLKQIKMNDGGGTLKIYGEKLNPDIPYKTLLMSNKDTAAFAVKEILEKYGMSNEDPINYCLVQLVTLKREKNSNSFHTKEFILADDACPLAILIKHHPSNGSIIFQIRRCPPDVLNKRRLERMPENNVDSSILSNSLIKTSQSIHVSRPIISTSLTNSMTKSSKEFGLPVLLEFSESNEDEILIHISNANPMTVQFKLAPAYAIYMMLRYRLSVRYNERSAQLSELLSPLIQKIVEMMRKTINLNHLNHLILAYWLANSSEFLYILKHDKNLSSVSLDSQEVLAGCVQIAFYYMKNLIEKKLDFLLNEFINPTDDEDTEFEIIINEINTDECRQLNNEHSIKKLIKVLNEAINVLRGSRVHHSLTNQLFSQLFHYISSSLFNKLVNDNQNVLCTKSWGLKLNDFLEKVESWAKKQGLEVVSKKYLTKLHQASFLLRASKHSLKDFSIVSPNCCSLNSLQIKSLLNKYVTTSDELSISQELINSLISAALVNADKILKAENKLIQVEEDVDLKLPFELPDDGYSIDDMEDFPNELIDYLEDLQKLGICYILRNRDGNWKEFMFKLKTDDHFTKSLCVGQNKYETENNKNINENSIDVPENRNTTLNIRKNEEIVKISLNKKNGSLGINIIGIVEKNPKECGIYVQSLVEGSPAYLDGRLETGDLLLAIDDYSLVGMSVDKTPEIFNKCGPNVVLTVSKKAAFLPEVNRSLRKKLNSHKSKNQFSSSKLS